MIISRTPFRISLFGGGSDYPQWYKQHGGSVLGLALNRYSYISVRKLPPFFEYRHRVVYSKTELVNDVKMIEHPAVRGALSEFGVTYGVEIHHDGDLPARSGLGSSSSFTVGLLHALHALEGRIRSKDELAQEAIYIEQHIIKENVGSQDQVWAAHGGLNRIDFAPGALGPSQAGESTSPLSAHAKLNKPARRSWDTVSYRVSPLILPTQRRDALTSHLLLFFTGFSRIASEIAGKQIVNLNRREKHIHNMMEAVNQAQNILSHQSYHLNEIGELMHECWRLKRDLATGISNQAIDEIYDAGREAGALGGKLLGAGGGGFMLFFAHPAYHNAIKERLRKLITLPVGIDYDGSRILVYEPDS